MRICISSDHRYPGKLYGKSPHIVHDNLVKGLAEMGHDVFYRLLEEPEVPLPKGVTYVPDFRYDVDILHINSGHESELPDTMGLPWVRTGHIDLRIKNLSLDLATRNWIFVSKTLAQTFGSERYVYNGLNPDDFIYSEKKDNYLLFVVYDVGRAWGKGLELAFKLSQKTGIPLWIAGGRVEPEQWEAFETRCRHEGARTFGHVTGLQKATLFAGAKALLFPTQLNEALGLVSIEALMSGTPVIASNRGATHEVLSESTGFIC